MSELTKFHSQNPSLRLDSIIRMQSQSEERLTELKKYLITELDSSKLPMSGCYVKNPQLIKADWHLVVPIKHMDYQVLLVNNVAQVTLEQQYENPTDSMLQVEYMFPVDPSACITSFKATFGESEIIGVVKEKEEAKQDYEKGLREGREVAYGEIDAKSRDIMNLKIGNVPPKTTVKLTISFMQTLDVSLNVFWRLCVQAFIWPRYINDATSVRPATCQPGHFSWTFKVELKSSKKIVYHHSPSHKLNELARSPNELTLVLPQSEVPSKDFIFTYTTEDFELPSLTCGRTDVSQSCLVSLIPRYSQLTLDDARRIQQEKAKSDFEPDMDTVKGEYVFLLDRSGSMDGIRITKAKQALVYFIKSLPKDSYFNVISFGSSCKALFEESSPYNNKTSKEAIEKVQSFGADMVGTEIEEPLTMTLTAEPKKSYPKHVFLLTDGAVSNTQNVKRLVLDNNKMARVHGIGVGSGASVALIKGCAQNGKGKAVFLSDNENVAEKIIQLLQSVLSPVITDFEFGFDQSIVDCVIPNPKAMPYISKNEPLCLYVMFKPGFQGSTSFKFKYADSVNHKTYQNTIAYSGKQEAFTFVDKMAHHRQIQVLCDCIKTQKSINNDMLMSEVADLRTCAVRESVKNQVLCEYTAFVCVGKVSKKVEEFTAGKATWKVQDQQEKEERVREQLRRQAISKRSQQNSKSSAMMWNQLDMNLDACISRSARIQDLCSQSSSIKSCNYQLKSARCYKKSSAGFGSQIAQGISNGAKSVGKFFSNLFGRSSKKQYCAQEQVIPTIAMPSSKKQMPICESSGLSGGQQQQSKATTVESKVTDQLSDYQQTDGSWSAKSIHIIAKLTKLTEKDIHQLVNKHHISLEIVLTVLAVTYLEKFGQKGVNALIIKKGRDWVKKQGQDDSVIREIEAKV